MRRFFIILLLVLAAAHLQAQQGSQKVQSHSNSLTNSQPIEIKFRVSTKQQINTDLTNVLSIENVRTLSRGQGYEVTAMATEAQLQEFLTHHIPYKKIAQTQTKLLTMATTVAAMANWDKYPTYSVYEQMMAGFAANYPALCDIDTIMTATPSGNYRILVARISDNVNVKENEPQFLFTSSMHGDEVTGYILMLRMINYLLTNYGSNAKVTNLVNNAEIWINPLANPEGTYYNTTPPGNDVNSSQRYNLAGKDLNRNYPDPRIGDPVNSGNSVNYPIQPETQAFMNFATAHHFNMSANFHGGAEVFNYPWDTWLTSQKPNVDIAWWERLGKAYVDSARLVTSTYMSDPLVAADGVTEGGDWYIITGGRQDYMNYFHHCREVTIELDVTKKTPVENLNLKWNQNYLSLLKLMQESLYGVQGIITDSCTGQPLRAKVWVNSFDQINDSSFVYSALPVGNYYRYMIAGTYSITFSAPGYKSKTLSGIVLNNGAATVVNVQLSPLSAPSVQFTAAQNNICSGMVQFTNTTSAATSYLWDFGDGTNSTQTNPQHTYTANGTFSVKLKALNCKGADSLVRNNYINISLPLISSVTNGSACGSGTVSLSAAGNGTINWFANPSGGSSLGTGINWTTPFLSTTTTYYAEATMPIPYTSIIGSGTTTTAVTGLTPFSSYYEGSREQYLVKASELLSAGIPAGNITSLAFNVTASGSYAQTNFTIKMAHTANTVISGSYGTAVGGFQTVYTLASLPTPSVGWKTFTFSAPFAWDGVSNVLIDICHDNDPANSCTNCYGANSTVAYTATTYNSCFGSYADNAQSCGVQASTALPSANYKLRPNMTFGYQSGCSGPRVAVVASITPSSKQFTVKAFLEGLYAGNGMMNQAQGLSGPQYNNGISDQITIELHNATAPYALACTFNNILLNANGNMTITSLPCNITGSYYIVIQHRNSIETWSALPVNFSGTGPFSFDFSTAAAQSYGNNQKQMSGNIYAIYAGNVNIDQSVDASDMAIEDNAVTALTHGYYPEDVNGDGIVDASDMAMIENNATAIIRILKP